MSDEEKKVDGATPETEAEQKPEEQAEAAAEPKKEDAPIVEENTDTKEAESAEIPEVTDVDESSVEELPNRDIEPGMLIRVHEKIKDVNSKGEPRERVQVFEGLVMGIRGAGVSRTMTVRKNSKGWMVEKIFPLSSPNIEKIEVVKKYRTRRAKLSYLKGKFKRKLKEVK